MTDQPAGPPPAADGARPGGPRPRRIRRWRRALPVVALAVALAAPVVAQEPIGARAWATAADSPTIEDLVEAGRLQEAAWAARAAGDSARADEILLRLEAILTGEPVHVEPLSMDSQGVSYTFRLDHGHGVESIFKVDGSDIFCPDCGADREVATYAVDRLLGLDLTPMTVPTRIVEPGGDTLSGSAMYFVHDAARPRDVGATKPDALRLLDAVVGNSDRHKSNWLILADGRVVAIDHNRAFQYRPAARPKTCWETEVDSIARPDALGVPFQRYRALPDDSLAAAVAGLDAALAARFLAMRDPIVQRIEARARDPRGSLPHDDCVFPP